jgi:hypothetical protein
MLTVNPSTPGTPGAPSALVATVNGSTVTFAWNSPGAGGIPTAFLISAGSSPGLSDLANFSTGSTATSFSVGNVPAGVFFVQVRAKNALGTSAPSNDVVLVINEPEGKR